MATFESRDIIEEMIANEGSYRGDPPPAWRTLRLILQTFISRLTSIRTALRNCGPNHFPGRPEREETMKHLKHVDALRNLNACPGAVEFAAQFPTLQKAWNACERGDWMLWLIGKQIDSKPWSEDRKPLLTCALDCAETVSRLWNNRTKTNVAVLRQWIAGEVSIEEAQKARQWLSAAYVAAADAADAAAYAAYAAYAADAAAYAAYADAADAAADAADAAYAAYAAADAAYAAARQKTQQQTANIVRAQYPKAPKL